LDDEDAEIEDVNYDDMDLIDNVIVEEIE